MATLASALALAVPAAAQAADTPPPPCGGVPQVVDAGGGHHPETDVLSAWFSEANDRLQAVIRVRASSWLPVHDDEDIDVAGYALLWEHGGRTAYVRAQVFPGGATAFDYGNFDGARFQSEGTTSGELAYIPYGGTATIDVPAATGAAPGARLARPFALTYDGTSADGLPHWVDQAPSGKEPAGPGDPARGSDYVVGSCVGGQPSGDTVVAVELRAPVRVRGARLVTVSGRLVPALAGVAVTVTARDRRVRTLRAVSDADGRFALRLRVGERTRVRALAGGVGSATAAVRVASVVRIGVRRARSGALRVQGRLRPALPGRVLLLGADDVRPTAVRAAGKKRFAFRQGRAKLPAGRYQLVYIPRAGLAERSTSNTIRIGYRGGAR